MRATAQVLGVLSLCAALAGPAAAQKAPAQPDKAGGDKAPETPRRPVVDTHHGVKISDDYRWLEEGGDPAVQRWTEAQDRHSRAILDRSPALQPLRGRTRELVDAMTPSYYDLSQRGATLFARKWQPPREQPLLVTLRSPEDPASERVLLDPVKVDQKATTTIDFYVPSLDGELVAVCLSARGTEDGTIHVYEVKTGKELPDVVPRAHSGTAGGSLAWAGDRSGFYYTRHPHEGERPKEDLGFYQQVYFHKLGTPASADRYAIGKDFPRIAETQLQASEDGKWILATVGNGDGGDYALHLLSTGGGAWQQLSTFEDGVKGGVFGRDGSLYLLSRKDAPRGKVLRLPLQAPRLDKAQVLVPPGEAVIEGAVPTSSRLYVIDLLGGVHQVRVLDLRGKAQPSVPLLPVSSVQGVVRLKGDEVLFRNESFLEPAAWYRYQPGGKPQKTALRETAPVSFSDVEVQRRFATSKDGTKVPLSILLRKGTKLDGKNPTLLTGYGGFGVSLTPGFGPLRKLWLEQGGVLAVANLRGGGEYGEEWHRGGYLTKKQNVFDDFIACAELLLAEKYTGRERLAIEGGSNGGLLMGAVLTQRPELFRAVVAHVGIYDMVRFALWPNGTFNVTEYGSVKDPEQFKALYAYSPYHHVVDGTHYPAVLFMSGRNDPRVNPADSRKMAARLQAATRSGRPVLLRTSASGHGANNLSEKIAQLADKYAFLFEQLGVAYTPITAAAPRAAGRQ